MLLGRHPASLRKLVETSVIIKSLAPNLKSGAFNGLREEPLFVLTRNCVGSINVPLTSSTSCLSTRAALQPLGEEYESDGSAILNVSRTDPLEAVVRRKMPARAVDPNQAKLAGSGIIVQQYEHLVKSGEIERDMYQMKVVSALQNLNDRLINYKPAGETFLGRLFGRSSQTDKPQGLYLYGSVGCGKTMLMDLFCEHCSVDDKSKKRVHFHSFMLDVHSLIHELKKKQKVNVTSSKKALAFNPIPLVAQEIVSDAWLLCLDEFQVTDIGDAMILKQLFDNLWQRGIVCVATSNRTPDDLYKNGLQRSAFLPFIPLLKENCISMALDSGIDYRQKNLPSRQPIYFLKSDEGEKELDKLFKIFASRETDKIGARTVNIKGRNVTFSKTCGGVADCTFEELCDRPAGAIDYLYMTQIFHTVIIRGIPQFTLKTKSQARRFITMIDTFYDHKVRCLFCADVPVKNLFLTSQPNQDELDDSSGMLLDDLGINAKSEEAKAIMLSGSEEVFAFDRTISRLSEMQTAEYWNQREVY